LYQLKLLTFAMRNLEPIQRAVELHARGVSTAAIANRLGVSPRQAARLLKYAREVMYTESKQKVIDSNVSGGE
jgi:orotate phosphoribosyltransferase-like protein